MKVGLRPEITLPELPDRRFPGVLVRTADSLDPATRTLLVEVDLDNPAGLLLPNAYSEVHFKLGAQALSLVIPTPSLIFRSEGLRVPILIDGNKVSLVQVKLGRDFGKTIEVLSGLDQNSAVITDPPDSLVEGETVRVVKATPSPGKPEHVEHEEEKGVRALALAFFFLALLFWLHCRSNHHKAIQNIEPEWSTERHCESSEQKTRDLQQPCA